MVVYIGNFSLLMARKKLRLGFFLFFLYLISIDFLFYCLHSRVQKTLATVRLPRFNTSWKNPKSREHSLSSNNEVPPILYSFTKNVLFLRLLCNERCIKCTRVFYHVKLISINPSSLMSLLFECVNRRLVLSYIATLELRWLFPHYIFTLFGKFKQVCIEYKPASSIN